MLEPKSLRLQGYSFPGLNKGSSYLVVTMSIAVTVSVAVAVVNRGGVVDRGRVIGRGGVRGVGGKGRIGGGGVRSSNLNGSSLDRARWDGLQCTKIFWLMD